MLITGCMMTFYQSTPAVVFWQWFNQSFNALVNYTNRWEQDLVFELLPTCLQVRRCGHPCLHPGHLLCGRHWRSLGYSPWSQRNGAEELRLYLSLKLKRSSPCTQVKNLPPLVGRLVPFMAVAAGNSINIPLMRRTELTDGEEINWLQ